MEPITRKRKSKGQFLLISSVVIGLMLISMSSTVADVQSHEFRHEPTAYHIQKIKYEASKIDLSSEKDIESFREMVDLLPDYSTETQVWNKGGDGDYDCFNVTLQRPGTTIRLKCIGED